MNVIRQIIFFSLTGIAMMSFSQCASVKTLEVKAPVEFKETYYREWSNPARYTGSGINLYLILASKHNNVELDSVYFRNKDAKLIHAKNGVYVGKFKTAQNEPHEIIMSANPKEEYGNTMPKKLKRFPFQLKDDECVVSYKKRKSIKYFKISNIKKKQIKRSPNTPVRQ